jgi:YbgC/YbaW family acyl-CoA thioester hydrolase
MITLLFRTIQTLLRQFGRPKLKSMSDVTIESYRVLPIDIDIFRHMNNAKYLNYMEAARWGFTFRSGFLKLVIQRGWMFPIRTTHVEYYRELKMFQKFEIHTQFVSCEKKWFYIVQRLYSGGKETARGMIIGTVRKGRENIPPEMYLSALGFPADPPILDPKLEEWINKLRASHV